MATAKATTDHDEIRRWVEGRGGHPARVKETGSGTDPGILRIDFPGFSGEDTLEEIPWEEFFEWFDRNNLAVLLSKGRNDRFNKLVSRETAGTTKSSRTKSSSRRVVKSPSKKASKSSSRRVAKSSSKKAASAKKVSTKKASATKASSKKRTSTKKAARKK